MPQDHEPTARFLAGDGHRGAVEVATRGRRRLLAHSPRPDVTVAGRAISGQSRHSRSRA